MLRIRPSFPHAKPFLQASSVVIRTFGHGGALRIACGAEFAAFVPVRPGIAIGHHAAHLIKGFKILHHAAQIPGRIHHVGGLVIAVGAVVLGDLAAVFDALFDVIQPAFGVQRGHAEADTEKGYFFRSDHFNFAKQGVPALYARAGLTHVDKGAAYGQQWSDDYTANRYHKPADEFDPNWDYAGVVDDLNVYFEAGKRLAEPGVWPTWSEGSEFRAAREASAAERAK